MRQRSWVVLPSLRPVAIVVQVIPIVLLLAGAICLVAGVKTLVDSRRFLASAVATNGVGGRHCQRRRAGAAGNGRRRLLRERDCLPPGRTVRHRPRAGSAVPGSVGSEDPSAYRVGDSIRVLYDPANPRVARLDTWDSRWGDSIGLVAIGLVLVVVGTVGYWLLRSRKRAARRAAPQNQPHAGT
jgi:hypothetical protein